MEKHKYKLIETRNAYTLQVAMDRDESITKLADTIQERCNDFLNVVEIRYNYGIRIATIILKEKIHGRNDFVQRLSNILQLLETITAKETD